MKTMVMMKRKVVGSTSFVTTLEIAIPGPDPVSQGIYNNTSWYSAVNWIPDVMMCLYFRPVVLCLSTGPLGERFAAGRWAEVCAWIRACKPRNHSLSRLAAATADVVQTFGTKLDLCITSAFITV